MLKVTSSAAASVDGFMATESGSVDWLAPFQGEAENRGLVEFYASVDVLLMGSRTYEFALTAPAWPSPDKSTWVFTRRPLRVLHPSIRLTSAAPSTLVQELDDRGMKHAWLMGGGRLAAAFRQQGLISRYVISVMAVLLGGGIPLMRTPGGLETLRLAEAKPFRSGVVRLTYEKPGA